MSKGNVSSSRSHSCPAPENQDSSGPTTFHKAIIDARFNILSQRASSSGSEWNCSGQQSVHSRKPYQNVQHLSQQEQHQNTLLISQFSNRSSQQFISDDGISSTHSNFPWGNSQQGERHLNNGITPDKITLLDMIKYTKDSNFNTNRDVYDQQGSQSCVRCTNVQHQNYQNKCGFSQKDVGQSYQHNFYMAKPFKSVYDSSKTTPYCIQAQYKGFRQYQYSLDSIMTNTQIGAQNNLKRKLDECSQQLKLQDMNINQLGSEIYKKQKMFMSKPNIENSSHQIEDCTYPVDCNRSSQHYDIVQRNV